MNALRVAHPEWLLPLTLAFAVTALCLGTAFWISRRRRRRLLGGAGGRVVNAAIRSDLALLVALAAIGIALLGPRIGERVLRVPSTGVDVVFALDVSISMDARDVPPSRLDRARRAVSELLARLEREDRVGLAAFAGAGVLLAPLTPDHDLLIELLSGLDTGLIRPASSHLGAGVRAGLEAFEAGSERPRILVVLSDGEDPEHRPDLGAAHAARAGVRVLAAAFGTEAGATIPDHGVPLADRTGHAVVTRRNLTRLGALAAATDGAVFPADSWGEVDFGALTAAIRRDAGSAPGVLVERRVSAVRVLPFAAVAFLILLLDGLPRELLRRLRRGAGVRSRSSSGRGAAVRPEGRSRRRALGAAVAGGIVLAATPSPAGDESAGALDVLEAQVRASPHDPASLVALGAARLSRGQRDGAARAFLAAAVYARDPVAAAVAYFDLGVAHLERSDLAAARDAFLDALALDPSAERARFNLEWSLLALEQRPQPQEIPRPREEPEAVSPPPRQGSAREAAEQPEEPPPAREPRPMNDDQRRRLLERLEDDPTHALRSAARDARQGSSGGVAAW